MCLKIETVQLAPFVKPHCVLIVADATVLLITGRLAHTDVRLQKHAGMFLHADICMAELLLKINKKQTALYRLLTSLEI